MEDLRQGRHRHLGNPADRLPPHALGYAQPRTARLRARCQLQLVFVFRQPRQVPHGARPFAGALARRPGGLQDARGCLGADSKQPGSPARLPAGARHGWLCAQHLGRSEPAHCCGQCLHHQAARCRPRDRLLAHPCHEHGELCRWLALPVTHWRRVHELLRLVLRPATGQPTDLGRANRCARVGRLVQQQLHHRLGLQRTPDPHARRPLLYRGALQRRQDRGRDTRLFRGSQVVGLVAPPQAGDRCCLGHGHGSCGAQRVLLPRWRQTAVQLLRRLRPPLHRPATVGDAQGKHPAGRHRDPGTRPLPACQ